MAGNLTPDQLRSLMLRRSLGTTLTSQPVIPLSPPPAIPPPVRTDIIPSPGGPATDPTAPPVRMPSAEAVEAWRRGVQPPVVQQPPEPPVAVPPAKIAPAFPAGGTAPIVATNPVVQQGPGGVTLNSTPIAPGWAGTVGLPSTPEEAKAFDKGSDYQKLMSGLDEVAKGLKPKAAPITIPDLLKGAPEPNQASQAAATLMTALLQGKRRNQGLTLTG